MSKKTDFKDAFIPAEIEIISFCVADIICVSDSIQGDPDDF